jgi:uncharacterized membrane protein (DUF373 family)
VATFLYVVASGPDTSPPREPVLERAIARFERVVILVILALLIVVVAVSTVELGWMLFRDISSWSSFALDIGEILDLFGFFLLVLIGLELMTTLKAFLRDGVLHAEVVLEVALIAIARKIIILDTSKVGGLTLMALAALVVALGVAFWLVRATRGRDER